MSKRVRDNLDRGLWVEYGAPEASYQARVYQHDTTLWNNDPPHFTFFVGGERGWSKEDFYNLDNLIAAMRKIQPDLRKWRLCEVD